MLDLAVPAAVALGLYALAIVALSRLAGLNERGEQRCVQRDDEGLARPPVVGSFAPNASE